MGSQRVIGGYNVFFVEIVDVSLFVSKQLHGFTRGCRGLQVVLRGYSGYILSS